MGEEEGAGNIPRLSVQTAHPYPLILSQLGGKVDRVR